MRIGKKRPDLTEVVDLARLVASGARTYGLISTDIPSASVRDADDDGSVVYGDRNLTVMAISLDKATGRPRPVAAAFGSETGERMRLQRMYTDPSAPRAVPLVMVGFIHESGPRGIVTDFSVSPAASAVIKNHYDSSVGQPWIIDGADISKSKQTTPPHLRAAYLMPPDAKASVEAAFKRGAEMTAGLKRHEIVDMLDLADSEFNAAYADEERTGNEAIDQDVMFAAFEALKDDEDVTKFASMLSDSLPKPGSPEYKKWKSGMFKPWLVTWFSENSTLDSVVQVVITFIGEKLHDRDTISGLVAVNQLFNVAKPSNKDSFLTNLVWAVTNVDEDDGTELAEILEDYS